MNGSTWAQKDLVASLEEITNLNSLFDNPSTAYSNGFTFAGKQFTLIRADESTIQAKGKKWGINPFTAQKTNQAIVVALGTADGQAGQVSKAVGSIGDYLVSVSY